MGEHGQQFSRVPAPGCGASPNRGEDKTGPVLTNLVPSVNINERDRELTESATPWGSGAAGRLAARARRLGGRPSAAISVPREVGVGKGRVEVGLRIRPRIRTGNPVPGEAVGTGNAIENCLQRWSSVHYRMGNPPIMESSLMSSHNHSAKRCPDVCRGRYRLAFDARRAPRPGVMRRLALALLAVAFVSACGGGG